MSALPLTRRAVALWPRWRGAGARERAVLAGMLTEPETRALERLERNVSAAGKPGGWWRHVTVGLGARRGVVETLLDGLTLDERAAQDLARSLTSGPGLPFGAQVALEAALLERARGPRVDRRRLSAGRPRQTLQTAKAGSAPTVSPDMLRRVRDALARQGVSANSRVTLAQREAVAALAGCSAGSVQATLTTLRRAERSEG